VTAQRTEEKCARCTKGTWRCRRGGECRREARRGIRPMVGPYLDPQARARGLERAATSPYLPSFEDSAAHLLPSQRRTWPDVCLLRLRTVSVVVLVGCGARPPSQCSHLGLRAIFPRNIFSHRRFPAAVLRPFHRVDAPVICRTPYRAIPLSVASPSVSFWYHRPVLSCFLLRLTLGDCPLNAHISRQ
jgi:hypothetical protein